MYSATSVSSAVLCAMTLVYRLGLFCCCCCIAMTPRVYLRCDMTPDVCIYWCVSQSRPPPSLCLRMSHVIYQIHMYLWGVRCIYTYIHTYLYVYIHAHVSILLCVTWLTQNLLCEIRIYIHTHVYKYMHTYTCMYIYAYIHMYIYIYTYIHMYLFMYTYIHTYTCICVYIHIYIHTHVSTYRYIYT